MECKNLAKGESPEIACKSQRRAFLRMNDISFTGFKMNMEIIQILRESSVHLEKFVGTKTAITITSQQELSTKQAPNLQLWWTNYHSQLRLIRSYNSSAYLIWMSPLECIWVCWAVFYIIKLLTFKQLANTIFSSTKLGNDGYYS